MKHYVGFNDDFKRIVVLIDYIYENEDMIWQEDWFDLYDNYLTDLIASLDNNIGIFTDGGVKYQAFRSFVEPCRDCWIQEDYFDFQEALLGFTTEWVNSLELPYFVELLSNNYPEFFG